MSEALFTLVVIMLKVLGTFTRGMATIACPYPVAMALLKKYPEQLAHVKGGKEFKEGLLPTGAKLLRCQRYVGKHRQLRWGYTLSCYAYDNSDGAKILKALYY